MSVQNVAADFNCPVCEAMNARMILSFLIKLFFYITKKSRQKCGYLKTEKSF